jgi:hypothetical protein
LFSLGTWLTVVRFQIVPEIDTSPSIAWRSVIPRLRTASRIAFGDREAAARMRRP